MFLEYLQVVAENFALYGDFSCLKHVNEAFDQLEEVLQGKQIANITLMFNLCSSLQIPVTNNMNRWNLFEYIIDSTFAIVAQRFESEIIKKICATMSNESISSKLERLGEVTRYSNSDCFEADWDKYIEDLKNETIRETKMSK